MGFKNFIYYFFFFAQGIGYNRTFFFFFNELLQNALISFLFDKELHSHKKVKENKARYSILVN